MPNRDDDRGFGRDRFPGHDRWRDEHRQGRPSGRDEDRSFERGRFNSDQARYGQPWNRDRYGSRADQDRSDYGSGYDRYSGDYGHGQEYGMEGGHPRRDAGRPGDQARERWTSAGGVPYGDIALEGPNRGFEEFGPPADYAFHPVAGHELEPDYRRWRDEQMRIHDRDYQEWRRAQHLKYDDDYRRFREERREHFGRTFQEWRAQQSLVGGVPDTGVAPGVTGDSGGVGRGYAGADSQRPSGMLDPSLNMTSDPVLSQTGRHPMDHPASPPPEDVRSPTPEFGKEPPAVQAAADGKGRKDEGKH